MDSYAVQINDDLMELEKLIYGTEGISLKNLSEEEGKELEKQLLAFEIHNSPLKPDMPTLNPLFFGESI